MFMEHLALTYKCHSSIGNSLDLKKMMTEVLETFVTETNADGGYFYLVDEKSNLYKYLSFNELPCFDENDLKDKIEKFNIYQCPKKNFRIIIMPLIEGVLFLVYKDKSINFDYIGSMFQDLVVKLNISIDACLNVQRMKNKNKMLKHLTNELKEQQKELIESDKYKSNFLANMSHELKTPLNSIIVLSSIMKKNKNSSLSLEQVKNLTIINNCGNDLLHLINDILDISKIEAGEISLNLSKVDINDLIFSLVEEMRPLALDKNLDIEFNCLLDDINLLTDSHRIKQILKNLLSNAIKFTNEGLIDVILEENANDITVKVIDHGIGIAQEKLSHIFDRFKQADGSTTRKYGGTGLGLAISKELANLLGGDIKAFSKIGEGSTFEMILPKKTDIKNISDDNVSISSQKNGDEQEIEDIVFFDMEDINTSQDIESKVQRVVLLNCDKLAMFPIVVQLKKHDIKLIQLDSLTDTFDLMEKEYQDLVVIDKENTKTKIDEFVNYCKGKETQTIILSKSEDQKYFHKDDVKENLVKEILEKLGR
ncbi:hypothetical protein GCM10012288_12900 [Malaciobacter pacificus]|uniref:histidine kinase n=1 Tax=Malaciobacter pacificus TaxID=1080223 RepID=A0A5C2H511_9BACT|nr:two-component system sensor histidine kinase [Malaciobacter pacificus]GGD40263.1 hypothetical protein GCM10012288_12900 [Malaciobacter pacificus]